MSPEGAERTQPSRLNQFYLDLPVLSVVLLVLRRVSQDVLVPKFHTDFRRDVRQLVDVSDRILPPARLFGDFRQQPGSCHLFRSP